MNKNNAKSITTYLIEGKPNGIKTVFISNQICKALITPRSSIDQISNRDEAKQTSLYFLLNEDEEKIYVGETENFYGRIKTHCLTKHFWNISIHFFSQNNTLTKADVKYLEYLAIQKIKEVSNISLEENSNTPNCPNLPEHQKSSMDEFFADIILITNFLGYNFFTPIQIDNNHTIFECNRNGINAKGIYIENKFILLKGSKISSTEADHYKLKKYDRYKMIKDNKLDKISNEYLITKQDIDFNSPSSASSFCLGKSSNGWVEWKSKEKQSLDDMIRKKTVA